jgi:hypothetical protein
MDLSDAQAKACRRCGYHGLIVLAARLASFTPSYNQWARFALLIFDHGERNDLRSLVARKESWRERYFPGP